METNTFTKYSNTNIVKNLNSQLPENVNKKFQIEMH